MKTGWKREGDSAGPLFIHPSHQPHQCPQNKPSTHVLLSRLVQEKLGGPRPIRASMLFQYAAARQRCRHVCVRCPEQQSLGGGGQLHGEKHGFLGQWVSVPTAHARLMATCPGQTPPPPWATPSWWAAEDCFNKNGLSLCASPERVPPPLLPGTSHILQDGKVRGGRCCPRPPNLQSAEPEMQP